MEKKKSKTRMILVLLFVFLFIIASAISLRGNYLQYKELGDNYLQKYLTELNYELIIFAANFISYILYCI